MPDPVVARVPAPDELVVEYLAAEPGRLTVIAAARRPVAACPACDCLSGCVSGRVQSRYQRRLADRTRVEEHYARAAALWRDADPSL